MATDSFGAAADHAGLSGLAVGDPHSQYTVTLQGTLANRPVATTQRAGTRYFAQDTKQEFISTGGQGATWQDITDAVTLGGAGPSGYVRGWDGNVGYGSYDHFLYNAAEYDWRRFCTVTFNASPDTGADYTGATFTAEVTNGIQSWGQSPPINRVFTTIAITNSNVATTSNARTATISGQWGGYDYFRVVKTGTFVYEIQGRQPAVQYSGIHFRLRQLSFSGQGSVVWDKSTTLPSPASNGTAQYLFTTTSQRENDSRGWVELTPLAGWTSYQTGIGNDWTPRARKVGGLVFTEGLFNGGSPTGTACTLPVGLRPGQGTTMREARNSAGAQRMDITAGGNIIFSGTEGAQTTGWHSIACQFPAEG